MIYTESGTIGLFQGMGDIVESEDELRDQMKSLYHRYIKYDTEFEIGIDYEEHKRLDDIFNTDNHLSMDNNSCFTIFDSTAIQVIRFIRRGSFTRFKNSELFNIFKNSTTLDFSDSNNLRLNITDPKSYLCLYLEKQIFKLINYKMYYF